MKEQMKEQMREQMSKQMNEQNTERIRDQIRKQITDRLFETGAIRVCPPGKPFWYTSGKIGPYYINTHYLFGNEKKAVEMLDFIDRVVRLKDECPVKVLEKCRANYNDDSIYRGVIDCLIRYIGDNIGWEKVDYISGGERRDWFFSILAADMLDKPHITLYKSGESVILYNGKVLENTNKAGTGAEDAGMKGASVLHIVDIINVASSYLENWIPAVEKLGGKIKWSLAVVDRLQGGAKNLLSAGVEPHSLADVDRQMFARAYEKGVICRDEYDMLLQYLGDPDGTMRKFIENNPGFLKEALNADEKTASRARKCIKEGYYGTAALQ
jgi:orotate phosphoribosyltransferase